VPHGSFIPEIRSFRRKSAIWPGSVNEQAVGLKLGLIGFVFLESEGVVRFHNPLSNRSLISFWLFGNWVCFAY